jgi:uncharacterized membrane protein
MPRFGSLRASIFKWAIRRFASVSRKGHAAAECAGLLMATALAAGCAISENVAPAVNPAMIEVGVTSGVSAETLKAGRTVFAGPCTACHSADPVTRYSLGEWRAIIEDDMARRAKLDGTARFALLAYIATAQKVTTPMR